LKNWAMKGLNRISGILDEITKAGTAFLFCWMLAVVLMGVFFRYVLNRPISWSEEIPRYIMVWLSFPAASIALRRKHHVGVMIVVDNLPRVLRKLVRFMGNIFILFFLFIATREGYLLARMVGSDQRTPMADLPMALLYYSIPVGCALMIIQLIRIAILEWNEG